MLTDERIQELLHQHGYLAEDASGDHLYVAADDNDSFLHFARAIEDEVRKEYENKFRKVARGHYTLCAASTDKCPDGCGNASWPFCIFKTLVYKTCSACGGTGEMADWGICVECNGSGQISDVKYRI